MATIDPSIALGIRPVQIEYPKQDSPINQMARVAELQYANQRNAMTQMQMNALQKEEAATNALNEAYRAAYNPQTGAIDMNALRMSIANGGYGAKLPAIEKSMAELDKEKLARQELEGKVKAQPIALQQEQAKLVDAKLKQSRAFLDTLDPKDPNAANKFIAWHEANHKDPILGPELAKMGITAADSRANIERAINTPGGLNELILRSKLGTDKFIEANKMHFVNQDLGGKIRTVGIEPLTGKSKVIEGTEAKKTATISDQIARERLNRDTGSDNVAHVVTDNEGNVTMINRKGEVIGSKLIGAGKPSATFEKSTQQQKQIGNDRKLAISELEEITKDGGLIDQSTSSYAGKGVDILARTIGTATPGDIAAGQLAPISDLVLKMVPRFEGPQSDKDTASYNRAAGQLSDTTLPAKIRKAAGKEILRLMKSRENQFGTPESAPNAGSSIDSLLDKYK